MRGQSALHAQCTGCQRPQYWQHRAKEARLLAERVIDETAKQTMLSVAEVCDRFAIGAAMCSIYELAVSRVTDC